MIESPVLRFSDTRFIYDSPSTPMTTAAICATREVSGNPSFCSGEQYDPDLSLYYLRARYYNQATGRFFSVDSQSNEGQRRYEYAAADPVNGMDPTGNNDIIEFELLNFKPSPIMSWPSFCSGSGGSAVGAFLPGCGDPGDPPPAPPPPPCRCGLKTAPQYDKGPSVKGGTQFTWHASFLNDSIHKPDCCEVRQQISWNGGPAPSWFYPPENQPNTWYQDRDQLNNRYGVRRPGYVDGQVDLDNFMDYYSGNDYYGNDRPFGFPHGMTLKFKINVLDTCNGGSTIYTSPVLQDNF